ncbi:MAG TPA: AMP-binding protein, partial [Mycobacterium sp.]|nr:AMP-binding protein [Mycobacterium sp.]
MTDRAEELRQRRKELIRRRIAESGAAPAASAQLPAIRAGERYRLSAGQRRMWFLQTLDPADTTLNICVGYRLTGAVDEPRLRAALEAVMARHAVLRATFGVDRDGEPYQEFSDAVTVPWQVHDAAEVTALARAEFGRPFDLTGELPLRASLVRTGDDEFVLLLVVHHICWDDDSWDVFFTEFSAAYNGRRRDDPAPQAVAAAALEAAAEPAPADIDYWKDALWPLPEPIELPGPAAGRGSRQADRRSRPLPAELFHRVEAFARQRSVTPFMVLLAAFGELIHRYTGAADLLVSVPVTERGGAVRDAIGYFGNTLLLRITIGPHDTFGSLVDAVRETCLGGFSHSGVGIDRVVAAANPQRTPGRDGMDHLVRLGFSIRKSAAGLALDGIAVDQLQLGAVTAQLPLALAVVSDPDGMCVEFEYQTDVLAAELVDQLSGHYLQLLDGVLSGPARPLSVLDMLDADERTAILAQSHGELVDAPATTMVAVLESAATGTPDAVAVIGADVQLSYAELHRRANRLARWLIAVGVGPESIVGLRMTTSVEFIVAMLAVLKAGAAYLPIEPGLPAERIDYLIADTAPSMVIGTAELAAAEAAAAGLSDAAVTDADRIRPLHPGNLAYVIYTSGSTGRPKGVAVAHDAIAEHVTGFIAEWSMTAEDRLLQSSSVSFDASLLDIFVTLAVGARLIVPRPDALADIDYIADLIERHRVTVLHLVPSMLSTLLLLPRVQQWRQLRHVPVGG